LFFFAERRDCTQLEQGVIGDYFFGGKAFSNFVEHTTGSLHFFGSLIDERQLLLYFFAVNSALYQVTEGLNV